MPSLSDKICVTDTQTWRHRWWIRCDEEAADGRQKCVVEEEAPTFQYIFGIVCVSACTRGSRHLDYRALRRMHHAIKTNKINYHRGSTTNFVRFHVNCRRYLRQVNATTRESDRWRGPVTQHKEARDEAVSHSAELGPPSGSVIAGNWKTAPLERRL